MRHALIALLIAFVATGCASSGRLRGGIEGKDLVKVARKQIGVGYRFGGDSPSRGFDCSGLVHYCFAELGVKVPHSTNALYDEGRKVPKGSLLPGDLVFFNISGHGVSHVGIYSGGDRMVHAPSSGSKVREETLDIKYWRQRYVGARRID